MHRLLNSISCFILKKKFKKWAVSNFYGSFILMKRDKISTKIQKKTALHKGYKLIYMSLHEISIWSPKTHPNFWLLRIGLVPKWHTDYNTLHKS